MLHVTFCFFVLFLTLLRALEVCFDLRHVNHMRIIIIIIGSPNTHMTNINTRPWLVHGVLVDYCLLNRELLLLLWI